MKLHGLSSCARQARITTHQISRSLCKRNIATRQKLSNRAEPRTEPRTDIDWSVHNPKPTQPTPKIQPTVLSRLPTTQLLRNILLGSVFTSSTLSNQGISLLARLANPNNKLLYPDTNPLIRSLLRHGIYNHFCAGTTEAEVRQTVADMKAMGYHGVIICPGREIMTNKPSGFNSAKAQDDGDASDQHVREWKELHLDTLRMISAGDYLGVKYTGAGKSIFQTLLAGKDPPQALVAAMHTLCAQALSQNSRIWIDAEQQAIQPTIDKWTLSFMREYNRGQPLISNTYQAYLKSTPATLNEHIRLAQAEGWTLGVKLVRGAYISSDTRSGIHDTKERTDECYDGLAAGLIERTLPGFGKDPGGPDVHVFLAGHNALSVEKAVGRYLEVMKSGRRASPTRWGQLQGMADEVSCGLLQRAAEGLSQPAETAETSELPGDVQARDGAVDADMCAVHVYKCLQWGTVGECMQFLVRRANENRGAAQRMGASTREMRRELWRRVLRL